VGLLLSFVGKVLRAGGKVRSRTTKTFLNRRIKDEKICGISLAHCRLSDRAIDSFALLRAEGDRQMDEDLDGVRLREREGL
jgi:hypothetical protein